MSGSSRQDEHRERGELHDHRERNEGRARMLVEEAGCAAADEPAHPLAGIKKSEGEVALARRQDSGDHRLEQRVLDRKPDRPQRRADEHQHGALQPVVATMP